MNINDKGQVLSNEYKSNVNPATNCGKLSGDLKLHNQTNLIDDACLQSERQHQSIEASDYMVSNFHSCDKQLTDVFTRQVKTREFQLRWRRFRKRYCRTH